MKKTASGLLISSLILANGGYYAVATDGEEEKTTITTKASDKAATAKATGSDAVTVEERNIGTHESTAIVGKTWLSFIPKAQDETVEDVHGEYVNVVNVYVEEDSETTRGAKFYHYDKSFVKNPIEITLREALEQGYDYAKAEKDEKARKVAEKEVTKKEPVNYSKTLRLGEKGHLEDFISVTGLPAKDTTYISLLLDKNTKKPLKLRNKYIYGVQTAKAGELGLIHFTVSDKLLADNLLSADNVGQEVKSLRDTESTDLNTSAIKKDTSEWAILRTFVQDGVIISQEIEDDPLVFDKASIEEMDKANKAEQERLKAEKDESEEKTDETDGNGATGGDAESSNEEADTSEGNVTEASVTLEEQGTEVEDESVPELAETGATNEKRWYDFLLFWKYF